MRVALPGILLGLFLCACPYVPEGDIRVESGTLPPTPGAAVSFALYCDYLFDGWERVSGPGQCDREWRVQGVLGGSAEYGTITSCGEYTAPTSRPPEPPLVAASECEWQPGSECLDACGTAVTLGLEGYP